MLRNQVVLVLSAMMLGGCAAAPATRRDGAALHLSLQVDTLAPGAVTPRALAPGAAVRDGDRLALTVWVDQPAQVYVVQYSPAGWSQLLSPTDVEALVDPGARVHVPAGGQRLTVAGAPGEELLYAIATKVPVLQIMPAFCRHFRLYCPEGGLALQRADAPPPPPPPPPMGTRPDERGPSGELAASVVSARADAAGVVILRFGLQHMP